MSDDHPLDAAARDLAKARAAVRAATERVRVAVVAAHADEGQGEAPLARRAGVDRMTVRKWLGKRA